MKEFEQKKLLKFERDMEYSVNKILDAYKGHSELPELILLCGGYGRDEGAWYADDEGMPRPYNDYDFVVVSNNKLPANEYRLLRVEMANTIGINWIDINFYTPSYIKHLKNTIKNVDLVHASKVLYGDSSIIDSIKVDPHRIGTYDTILLYKTRIWTFLGAWEGELCSLESEKSRFFRNQMAKGILAGCDLILIKDKKYTSSYVRRADIILGDYNFNRKYASLVKWAISEKMSPQACHMDKNEVEELYWGAKDFFCYALRYSDKALFYRSSHCKGIKSYLICRTDVMLHIMYDFLKKHECRHAKELDVLCAQNFVFWANDHGKINQQYISNASKILRKWSYTNHDISDWDEIRYEVAKARNNV